MCSVPIVKDFSSVFTCDHCHTFCCRDLDLFRPVRRQSLVAVIRTFLGQCDDNFLVAVWFGPFEARPATTRSTWAGGRGPSSPGLWPAALSTSGVVVMIQGLGGVATNEGGLAPAWWSGVLGQRRMQSCMSSPRLPIHAGSNGSCKQLCNNELIIMRWG